MILNLADRDASDLSYDIVKFSDSQTLLTINNHKKFYLEDVKIFSRMTWDDLQLIAQASNILRENKAASVSLLSPYMLGGRSDRKFSQGSTNYIKNILAPFINSLEFDEVIVYDPHSLAIESCIDCISVRTILPTLVNDLRYTYDLHEFTLIAPDEGAIKRTEVVAHKVGAQVVNCIKRREVSTGTILSVDVLTDDLSNKPCIIVDDICDGGATFIALAKELKAKNAGDLYLAVTHGIFSRGFDELSQHFVRIATTNSVRDFTKAEQKYVSDYRFV